MQSYVVLMLQLVAIISYIGFMNSTQIIGAIMLATGKGVEAVAKDNGYSKFTFYRVINNTTNSPKVQELIASIINRPIDEIWPPTKEQHHA